MSWGRKNGDCLMGTELLFWGKEKVLKMDSDDGGSTV